MARFVISKAMMNNTNAVELTMRNQVDCAVNSALIFGIAHLRRLIFSALLLSSLVACGGASDSGSNAASNDLFSNTDAQGAPTSPNSNESTDGSGMAGNMNTVGTTGAANTVDTSGTLSTDGDTAGATTSAGVTDSTQPDQTGNNAITSGQPNQIAANTLPTTNAQGQVTWTFDAQISGLEVVVQPFVELPLASNGSPARWNAMSSFDNRLFVANEHDGQVYEVSRNNAQLWFDIKSAIQSHTGRTLDTSNPFHSGVRGIAFHPDFLINGKFYASIMEQRPIDTSMHTYLSDDSGIAADSVLVEWTADTTSFEIDISSYREVFRVGVPELDHPIKQITFNPHLSNSDADFGNLYIAHGDGSVESSLAGTGQANNALGKILRINPLQKGSDNYTVPADNPFTADTSLPDEVFSYGHRNPHHLAFSSGGHLLATEAGRDNIDEINLVAKGNNYGWALREGAFVHLDEGSLLDGIAALPPDDATNGLVYPAVQFGHHGNIGATFTGEALGGGYVVENGSALEGQFFFIDFPKTGLLFHTSLSDIVAAKTTGDPEELTNAKSYVATIQFDHDANPDTQALDNNLKDIVQSASGYVNTFNRIDVRIFQGSNGELYLTSKRNNMMYVIANSIPD